ncbi:unnamed protein product [Lupinus luteus]|uniref:Uncharacterized protein n=1 Tax=Lupinus luteus TaxID=3873 RepID=A0AAV1YIV7_LUPLU
MSLYLLAAKKPKSIRKVLNNSWCKALGRCCICMCLVGDALGLLIGNFATALAGWFNST